MNERLKGKNWNYNMLKRKYGSKFLWFWISLGFFIYDTNSTSNKTKIDEWDFIVINNAYIYIKKNSQESETTAHRMRQDTNKSHKGLVSRMYNSYNLTGKRQPSFLHGQRIWVFFQVNIQMTNNHLKKILSTNKNANKNQWATTSSSLDNKQKRQCQTLSGTSGNWTLIHRWWESETMLPSQKAALQFFRKLSMESPMTQQYCS